MVTLSGLCKAGGEKTDAPPVNKVGYSMPPEAEVQAGSTPVTWS
jgi:hypothetical protein